MSAQNSSGSQEVKLVTDYAPLTTVGLQLRQIFLLSTCDTASDLLHSSNIDESDSYQTHKHTDVLLCCCRLAVVKARPFPTWWKPFVDQCRNKHLLCQLWHQTMLDPQPLGYWTDHVSSNSWLAHERCQNKEKMIYMCHTHYGWSVSVFVVMNGLGAFRQNTRLSDKTVCALTAKVSIAMCLS